MNRFMALAWLLAGTVSSCGFDGLLFTPRGFEPSKAPRAVLVGNARPGARLEVMSFDGDIIAAGDAPTQGEFRLELPVKSSTQKLRLRATLNAYSSKTMVARAEVGVITGLGRLDAFSTAMTQVILFKIQSDAGSSLAATPATAIEALRTEIQQVPSSAFQEFVALVDSVLKRAISLQIPSPAFGLESYHLSNAFVAALAESSEFKQDYLTKLSKASADYEIRIRCDPARLNVLFAVDLSGRAKDGIGNPQLIRQATKESRVFLGLTTDESSPIISDDIPKQLRPNDPNFAMNDEGKNGDELAKDGVFSIVVALARGARIKYKYTNGAAGEGFTGTEEWPGNARILEIKDVLTSRPDGKPDCLLIRRDAFGDEASNKNFVNLHPIAKTKGGSLRFETDLGGIELPKSEEGIYLGGLSLQQAKTEVLLTPKAVAEARENGRCVRCPPPLVLNPNDQDPPRLLFSERLSSTKVMLRFSEPILENDANNLDHYLLLDSAGLAVRILEAKLSGADITLQTEAFHPSSAARIRVRKLRDVSVQKNELIHAEIPVAPDKTPPEIRSVRALSLLDVDAMVEVSDPTVGEIIEVQFSEAPQRILAEDPAHYSVLGLNILSASWIENRRFPTVQLRTSAQQKGQEYRLEIDGLKDLAGNAVKQSLAFSAFALYRVRFSVLANFAFANSSGMQRGLPRNEQLFLTGMPLAEARNLAGRSMSIYEEGGRRTDVTGWPKFEMKRLGRQYGGQDINEIELLLPPGRWAYKAAHGLAGEHLDPPRTLEKVYKTLATTNDGTGVRIDPISMIAANLHDYSGASLSESGLDPPRRNKVFKREAPDEVCDVVNRDVECPMIVVGAWRDWILDPGGRTRDYDDGLLTLPPHRPTLPDLGPPRLQDVRARDSYSVLLSFDEALSSDATFEFEVFDAETLVAIRAVLVESELIPPHQMIIRAAQPFALSRSYGVRYRGAQDRQQPPRIDLPWRQASFLSLDIISGFRPLLDLDPPKILSVTASDIDQLEIRFDEIIDPGSLRVEGFGLFSALTQAVLPVLSVHRSVDGQTVVLGTAVQTIRSPLRLRVEGVGDLADPSNVMTSTTIDIVSFGENVAPEIVRVRAIDPTHLMIRFSERIQARRAMESSTYRIAGLELRAVSFSGELIRRNLAFNQDTAPLIRDIVLITTSRMSSGQSYTLYVDGIQDLSGNTLTSTVVFTGLDRAPSIDVVLEYEVSKRQKRGGRIPSRALDLAEFSDSREGLYVLGARLDAQFQPEPGSAGPVNNVLGGFPTAGAPLEGIEARLRDDGRGADRVAGDGIFSLRVSGVPLGTSLIWKSFASFTTQYRDDNPGEVQAAFADALPGPSVYADGQEYPGNENGVLVLDEGRQAGVLRVRCLFGDEVTYKKHTGAAVYFWAATD